MLHVIRIVVGLIALLFLVMGGNLMLSPATAAEGLSVTPIGTAGLNTLRGDFGGMFIGCSMLLMLALVQGRGWWLQAVALLMSLIALGRLIGFIVDGAPTSTTVTAFVVEIVIALVLLAAARFLTASGRTSGA